GIELDNLVHVAEVVDKLPLSAWPERVVLQRHDVGRRDPWQATAIYSFSTQPGAVRDELAQGSLAGGTVHAVGEHPARNGSRHRLGLAAREASDQTDDATYRLLQS